MGEGSTNSQRAICFPPCFFSTNDCKRAGTSKNRSSFSLLCIGANKGGGLGVGVQMVIVPFVLPPPRL